MNYLAHACLSFDEPGILVGNMISDFVKGRKKFDYPDLIRKGIELHRAIDEFTDNHPATKAAKNFFRPAYGLYAGAFIDIVYDHFLAADPAEFPADHLSVFADKVYTNLALYESIFPEKFAVLFHYMRKHNWLYHYRSREGACRAFGGLVKRAAYLDDPEMACKILEDHYEGLEICYRDFYPAVKRFAWTRLQELIRPS